MSQILHSNAFYSRESSGLASLVDTDLAGENVTKGSKGVVEGLVVNALVEVLDEDVSLSSLSESRVSLTPHDSAWPVLDQGVVEVLESSLAVSRVEVVDVGVSKGSSGDGVSADSDARVKVSKALVDSPRHSPGDGTNHVEDLEEHGLGDGVVELTNVETGARASLVGGWGSGGSSSGSAVGWGGGGHSRS
jgi:hypothetical protein